MTTLPLPLPADFDAEAAMPGREVDGRRYHSPVQAAPLAYALVANGSPADLQQAERTLRAIVACQETHRRDPHYGNFLWEREDAVVEDLNAVQFVLFNIIPIVLQWRSRLAPALVEDLLAAIRCGLDEVCRIDVAPAYTNIVLKDITNSCLGGELLADAAIAARGSAKLRRWLAYTDQSGIPAEFNSPGYARVSLQVLRRLGDLVADAPTRARARLAAARLGLSCVLHANPRTNSWAGPYSRAYLDQVFIGEQPPQLDAVREWLSDGTLPPWLANAIAVRPPRMQVDETADRAGAVAITCFHSRSFDLGVASQELATQSNRFIALQSNVCLAHYTRGDGPVGVFLTRYLIDDHWIGDYRQTPSRSASLLAEEGRFHGVQDGPRALCMYAPRAPGSAESGVDGWHRGRAAKAALIWDRADLVEQMLIDGAPAAAPCAVPPHATVVVTSGDVHFAVRPLAVTDLGVDAPLRLVERHGCLLLELYNYLGAPKAFWEQAFPGSFFQGLPQCGFYLELGERAEWADGAAFAAAVGAGELGQRCAPPDTWRHAAERAWEARYQRDGRALQLTVDLMSWRLMARGAGPAAPAGAVEPGLGQLEPMQWPMLESTLARQSRDGAIALGGAQLRCGRQAAWLYACPDRECWAAGYHGADPEPLALTVRGGAVEVDGLAAGQVIWDRGRVQITAAQLVGAPRITGAREVMANVER